MLSMCLCGKYKQIKKMTKMTNRIQKYVFSNTLSMWLIFKNSKAIVLSLLILVIGRLDAQDSYIYAHSETANVHNGKKITIVQDLYYQAPSNKMVIHFIAPQDYIYISSLQGEAKFYYPKTNQVKVMHDLFLSSKNNLLYYFANNQVSDLGLQEGGYTLTQSRNEGDLIISTWQAPLSQQKYISKAEIVHQNYLPKYLAYYSPQGKIIQKIYYLNYQNFGNFVLPQRLVEIEYKAPQDSVIHSTQYSKIRSEYKNFDGYFNFKIPENAKVLE